MLSISVPDTAIRPRVRSRPVYLPNHANVDDSQLIGAFSQSSVGNNAGDLDYSVIKFDQSGIDAGLDRAAVRGANGTTLAITGTARPVIGAPHLQVRPDVVLHLWCRGSRSRRNSTGHGGR